MRRLLIGHGTPLGDHLAASPFSFAEALSYEQALKGFRSAEEIVLVSPACSGRSLPVTLDRKLADSLQGRTKRLIVLSTVDAYPTKSLPFDEMSSIDLPLDRDFARFPWLRHEACERLFATAAPQTQIVRLPEIFGRGFVKGVAGHLLGRSAYDANRVGIHQWYPVDRLLRDLIVTRHLKAPIVNLCTEPVRMDRVLDSLFDEKPGQVSTPAPYSRIKTRYSEAFGGTGGYIMTAKEVVADIRRYAKNERHVVRTRKSGNAEREFHACLR